MNDLTLQQWVDIVAAHEGRCFYCHGVELDPWIEHMQPLFHGGDNTATNVVPSCPDCNRRKSKKSAENFLANRCHRGHDLTPDNVYVFPNGKKTICKTCRRESFRRYREKKRRQAA